MRAFFCPSSALLCKQAIPELTDLPGPAMFQRPLICTDFSDGLHRLVQFVPSLAASGIEQIVFLHTLPLLEERGIPKPDTEKVEAARDRLTSMLPASTGIEVKIEIQSGQPLDTILRTAETYHTDVILLGMPSRSLLNEKLFGSTTIGLSQRTTIPLMTLRPQLVATYTSEELDLRCRHLFRHLLLPYNGDSSSQYLIERIKQTLQGKSNQGLEEATLCWVVDDSGRREIPEAQWTFQVNQAQQALGEVKTQLEALGLKVGMEVRRGDPELQILEVAQMSDVSAVAISSSNVGRVWEWSVASCAGELLRRSWHPVIFFPPKGQ